MSLSDEQLLAIETRAKAATPGPWDQVQTFPGKNARMRTLVGAPDSAPDAGRVVLGEIHGPARSGASIADSAFIAAARSDIPVLVEEVKRLRGVVAKQANDGAKLAVDRDEWRDTSRDWRQRAERAEKVEAIYRGAVVEIKGLGGCSQEIPHQTLVGIASKALREASEVRVERVTGETR